MIKLLKWKNPVTGENVFSDTDASWERDESAERIKKHIKLQES